MTAAGLTQWEQERAEAMVDPIRRKVFLALASQRVSVEEALGCEVVVSGSGADRQVDFRLPTESVASTPEAADSGAEAEPTPRAETPLFRKLVQYEATEQALREAVAAADPNDVESVAALASALTENNNRYLATLILADARINGLFVAEGVRSGLLKSRLAETGVKVGEAAVAAGVIYGVAQGASAILDASAHHVMEKALSRAADIKAATEAAPGQEAALWQQIAGFGQGVSPEAIQAAANAQNLEAVTQAVNVAGSNADSLQQGLDTLAHTIEQIKELQALQATGTTQAAAVEAAGIAKQAALEVASKGAEISAYALSALGAASTLIERTRGITGKAVTGVQRGARWLGTKLSSINAGRGPAPVTTTPEATEVRVEGTPPEPEEETTPAPPVV